MNTLATALQQYFTSYARAQRDLSPNTIAAYRDTWRLLITHLTGTLGVCADRIDFQALEAERVTAFLDHLEQVRGNGLLDTKRAADRYPGSAQPRPAQLPRTRSNDHADPGHPAQTPPPADTGVPEHRRGKRAARCAISGPPGQDSATTPCSPWPCRPVCASANCAPWRSRASTSGPVPT